MSYRIVGPTCAHDGCRRPPYIDGLCPSCYRAASPGVRDTGRAHATELCETAAAMRRTVQEIRGLAETGER